MTYRFEGCPIAAWAGDGRWLKRVRIWDHNGSDPDAMPVAAHLAHPQNARCEGHCESETVEWHIKIGEVLHLAEISRVGLLVRAELAAASLFDGSKLREGTVSRPWVRGKSPGTSTSTVCIHRWKPFLRQQARGSPQAPPLTGAYPRETLISRISSRPKTPCRPAAPPPMRENSDCESGCSGSGSKAFVRVSGIFLLDWK